MGCDDVGDAIDDFAGGTVFDVDGKPGALTVISQATGVLLICSKFVVIHYGVVVDN